MGFEDIGGLHNPEDCRELSPHTSRHALASYEGAQTVRELGALHNSGYASSSWQRYTKHQTTLHRQALTVPSSHIILGVYLIIFGLGAFSGLLLPHVTDKQQEPLYSSSRFPSKWHAMPLSCSLSSAAASSTSSSVRSSWVSAGSALCQAPLSA